MKEVEYLESHGLRVVPVYQGLSPVGFNVETRAGRVVENFKTLYEAEDFIKCRKPGAKDTVMYDSAAELEVG